MPAIAQAQPVLPMTPSRTRAHLPRVAVGIATRGRPAILKETLTDLSRQLHRAAGIFVSYASSSDVEDAPEMFSEVRFLNSRTGSCAQRNCLLENIGPEFDVVVFMDDDFYLHPSYLQRVAEVFGENPEVLGASGIVLADGANGPGIDLEKARAVLADVVTEESAAHAEPPPIFNTYGCNMAFRLSTVQQLGLRFDERLPAYGWYEDLDFSRRLAPAGRLVQVPGAYGVHLGAKVGRTSGRRLGYSQIVNCVYLAKKGTYPWRRAMLSSLRNVLANLFRSIAPEPYIDRRGRLLGNLLGIWDALRGRERPERILELN
jgi:GT2 family glycosyltransferase